MKAKRKSLFCWLGWHRSTFYDSAGFVGAARCNGCLKWIDEAAGADVEAFRHAVTSGEVRYAPDTTRCWDSHDGTIQRAHDHATDGSIVPEALTEPDNQNEKASPSERQREYLEKGGWNG